MNALTPAVGSNQFITKFDSDAKEEKKKKFKIKVKFRTKVKIAIVLTLMVSLYVNYYLLKTNYVFTCWAVVGELKQTQWGHFGHLMNRQRCDGLVDNKLKTLTLPTNEQY